jgi:hypothetical protein
MQTEEKSQRFKVNRSREQTPTLEILWSGEEFESNRKQNLENTQTLDASGLGEELEP